MSNHAPVDLSPTLRELAPRSVATWQNFTRAGTWVGAGVVALLLGMLVFLVIL